MGPPHPLASCLSLAACNFIKRWGSREIYGWAGCFSIQRRRSSVDSIPESTLVGRITSMTIVFVGNWTLYFRHDSISLYLLACARCARFFLSALRQFQRSPTPLTPSILLDPDLTFSCPFFSARVDRPFASPLTCFVSIGFIFTLNWLYIYGKLWPGFTSTSRLVSPLVTTRDREKVHAPLFLLFSIWGPGTDRRREKLGSSFQLLNSLPLPAPLPASQADEHTTSSSYPWLVRDLKKSSTKAKLHTHTHTYTYTQQRQRKGNQPVLPYRCTSKVN
jgi:hypothetical protein